ncbi:MAG: hypothetical protein EAZ89_15405, partial [Bacteroidetes bacterium]
MKQIALSFLLIICCLTALAGIDPPAYMLWNNQQLVVNNSLTIEDNKWALMNQQPAATWGFVNHSCKNEITLSLDPFMQGMAAQEIAVDAKIRYWNPATGANPVTVEKTFTLTYNPHKGSDYIGKSYFSFTEGYKVEITPLAIRINNVAVANANTLNWLRLEARIEVDRTYDFDRLLFPALQGITTDPLNSKVRVEWLPQPGAEAYRLEWTYIPDYHKLTATNTPVYQSPDSLNYDFRSNSVRVVVNQTHFELDQVLSHGYYIFRVSAIGRLASDPSISLDGGWSMDHKGLVSSALQMSPLPVLTVNETHRHLLNWIYTATYAEEGKKSAALTYADGAQNTLQSVARFSEQPTSFVTESILDSRGRPAVQTLPASSETSQLDYFPNFNRDNAGDKYSWNDFDPDNTATGKMSTQSGASRYYSPANPDQDGPQAYLPDAQGYPFSRVQYDAKGRVVAQGGAGPDHQVEEHATRMHYVTPFQEELNRLFGTEVGFAERYFKTVTEDPNGQMAISIANLSGQTVATALEGDSPANLDKLASNLGPQDLTLDLNSGGRNRYDEENEAFVVDFRFFATTSG